MDLKYDFALKFMRFDVTNPKYSQHFKNKNEIEKQVPKRPPPAASVDEDDHALRQLADQVESVLPFFKLKCQILNLNCSNLDCKH